MTLPEVMSHYNIGTIGHVDSGKTTLTSAITKVLSEFEPPRANYQAYDKIDSIPEEQERGITISSAHVEYIYKRHYTHVDCPGHKQFVKNMITGASQLDGFILVISTPSGFQEQTKEHILIMKELGKRGWDFVVYMNKIDMVLDDMYVELAIIDVEEQLKELGIIGGPADKSYGEDKTNFIAGSAKRALEEPKLKYTKIGGKSIFALLDAIEELPKRGSTIESKAIMPIEKVFSISGRGTVVTGLLTFGNLTLNDEVEILGLNSHSVKSVVTGIEAFHKSLDLAESGFNIGVLLRGVKKNEITRGQVLIRSGAIGFLSNTFEVSLYLYDRPIPSNFRPQFYFHTANVTGRFEFELGLTTLTEPNTFYEKVFIRLDKAVYAWEGLHFAVREGGRMVAGGKVIADNYLGKEKDKPVEWDIRSIS